MQAGTRMRGSPDVVKLLNAGTVPWHSRQGAPDEELVGCTGTCIRVTSYQVDIRTRQVGRGDYKTLAHGAFKVRDEFAESRDDAIGKTLAQSFTPGTIGLQLAGGIAPR